MKSDVSNMGRCDICGEPVDLRDDEDELVMVTKGELGNEAHGIPPEEAAHAMADALEASDNVKDDMVAEALREDTGYRLHGRCYEETTIPDWPTMEEFTE